MTAKKKNAQIGENLRNFRLKIGGLVRLILGIARQTWQAARLAERIILAILASLAIHAIPTQAPIQATSVDAESERRPVIGANLIGANLDYSSGISLSCKTSKCTVSLKLLFQYFAHFCTFKPCDDELEEFAEIRPYALKSHQAGDLGLLGECHGKCESKK